MKSWDFIKGWLGGRSNGPAKRPEGGFITKHRDKDAKGPDDYTPPHTGVSNIVSFGDLFQGRELGYHPQGYGPKVPTLLRGKWRISVSVNGVEVLNYTGTGAGGDSESFTVNKFDNVKIMATDDYQNSLVIRAMAGKSGKATLNFRQTTGARQLVVPFTA